VQQRDPSAGWGHRGRYRGEYRLVSRCSWMSRCNDPKIYAFEPAPVVFELLKINCQVYGKDVQVENAGVSDKAKTATLNVL